MQDVNDYKSNSENNVFSGPIDTLKTDIIYNFELKIKKISLDYKNSFTFKLYWKTKSK